MPEDITESISPVQSIALSSGGFADETDDDQRPEMAAVMAELEADADFVARMEAIDAARPLQVQATRVADPLEVSRRIFAHNMNAVALVTAVLRKAVR